MDHGGHSGGGGGGTVSNCDLKCQIDRAKKDAVNALGSQSCSDAVSGGSPQAAATLGAQNGAAALASITTGDLGNYFENGIVAMTHGTITWDPHNVPFSELGPLPYLGPPYSIELNIGSGPLPVTPFLFDRSPGYSLLATQAITLLHETGHAATFNGLSSIVQPNDAGSLSMQNQYAIGDACFPQGDFGGNQGSVSQAPTDIPAVARPKQPNF